MPAEPLLNALSIDVEDYFQVSNFESVVDRADWESFPSRVVENTRRLLRILEQHSVRATFFILGWTADKYPFLVKEIAAAGHEIGSHTFWHRLIYRMQPEDFRQDLIQSREVLEEITGQRVDAFRAPSFSITKESLWALEILREEGFRFDSSIFPTRHDRYGIPEASREIHEIETEHGSLWEFPMSVGRYCGMMIPASGGGYFRLYPYRLTRRLLRQINRAGRPVMFYLHPWEIDPEQPLIEGAKFTSRHRHRVNLAHTEAKLHRLLSDFRFGAMGDVLRSRQIVSEAV